MESIMYSDINTSLVLVKRSFININGKTGNYLKCQHLDILCE